jgi:hypothetical protein
MMQATTVAPTAPVPQQPAAPALAGGGDAVTSGLPALPGIPRSVSDVRALRAERAELSNQLESAAGRRARLAASLKGKEGADRAGIEARITLLDKRIVQLESDLAETGRLLTMAPNALVASADANRVFGGRMDSDTIAALGSVFMIFVLAPIAFAYARRVWKRSNVMPAPQLPADTSRRLERLEQGVDAIAIEVERISEGQRFVTRLLSESTGTPVLQSARQITQTASREGSDI